ncbi:MAG: hypothetical protein IKN50_06385 [Clostridia bacterium]|nr:hypothetical protein [Clostridia bacterium]
MFKLDIRQRFFITVKNVTADHAEDVHFTEKANQIPIQPGRIENVPKTVHPGTILPLLTQQDP